MEFNFEFQSPTESDGSYFDTYFSSSPPASTNTSTNTSTTTVSHHSSKSSLGSAFSISITGASTSYQHAGGPGAGAGSSSSAGGALPRSSDTDTRTTMTEGYVKPPERIHHWLDALQPSISATLDKAHHHCCLTGGEDVLIAPVSDLVSCIIYHHFCSGLDPATHICAHSVTSTDDILH